MAFEKKWYTLKRKAYVLKGLEGHCAYNKIITYFNDCNKFVEFKPFSSRTSLNLNMKPYIDKFYYTSDLCLVVVVV